MDEIEKPFRSKKPVKLAELVEGIDFRDGPLLYFVNIETGAVENVLEEYLKAVEETDEDEMEKLAEDDEEMRLANDIFLDYDEKYLPLPGIHDVDEYEIMSNFCYSLEDKKLSEILCQAIRGRGAFGRFKDGIYKYGISDDWYRFREEAFKEIAIDWCIENQLSYIG